MVWTLGYRIGMCGVQTDGIYPVAIDETGKIVAIFKYPAGPRNPGTLSALKQELILYARAAEFPTFDRNQFGCWDYFNVNSWDDSSIVSDQDVAKMLENCKETHG